jgi:WD40 repeat protein
MRITIILILAAGLLMVVGGQTAAEDVPPLTADNLDQFGPAVQIDFAALEDAEGFDSGWFAFSGDGAYIAVTQRDGGLVIFDSGSGEIAAAYNVTRSSDQPGTVLDASFGTDNRTLAALHADGERYYLSVHPIDGDEITVVTLPESPDMPVRVWLDDDSPHAWVEVLAQDSEHYVMRVPLPGANEEDSESIALPSGPENDSEAYVRIGRIPVPLAVTASLDGVVKLWNLETGEVTYEVQIDGVPVFGRVNETSDTQMVWRDSVSEGLYLLDFVSGENREIAQLDGEYIQAILLSPAGDVILGVAVDERPVVVAWDTATGELIEIGEYRQCSRVPDLVRLSADGSTLVIGCDSGLDIWRVRTETNDNED